MLELGVDPRVRGAVIHPFTCANSGRGRSPRARGSHWREMQAKLETGSIPACAGQSPGPRLCQCSPRVDPRVRGAVPPVYWRTSDSKGRSPRARGSLALSADVLSFSWSIPACAGQSVGLRLPLVPTRVDPRVRGAVRLRLMSRSQARGRSPRARGSRKAVKIADVLGGSIPACAGQSGLKIW